MMVFMVMAVELVGARLPVVPVDVLLGATTGGEETGSGGEGGGGGLRTPALVGVGEEEALDGEGGVETAGDGPENPPISTKSS